MNGDPREFIREVLDNVGDVMFGMDSHTKLVLVALLSGGHVLLEGNPGLGKTELVKAIAGELGIRAGRIQFTPDLMPADITGGGVPTGVPGEFRFERGPIFTNLLLADEINRATPKTQAAMLEAMAEKQVTAMGEIHLLPQPFMVLATQNPIEQQGTYELPEAQRDRFMMKLFIDGPGEEALDRILGKTSDAEKVREERERLMKSEKARRHAADDSEPGQAQIAATAVLLLTLREKAWQGRCDPAVREHVRNLVLASYPGYEPSGARAAELSEQRNNLDQPYGPRLAIALLRAVLGWHLLYGGEEERNGPAVQSLISVVIPVLEHRTLWKWRFLEEVREQGRAGLIAALIDYVWATAPESPDYRSLLDQELVRQGLRHA